MVKAGDKYLDTFPWGVVERFHTIGTEGRVFTLLEKISIIMKDRTVVKGEIAYISEEYVEIQLKDGSCKKVKFEDIKTIYR